jgi:nitronate monooxygenase
MAQKFRTRITEMLGVEHPILCGGMQWLSRAEFVAEICNAGGFAFITAESFETPQALREEIKKMRELTEKPFGVNISMLPEFQVRKRTMDFCDVVCEEGIEAVETAGRSPEEMVPKFKQCGVKIIHKVTSVKHALKAQTVGADAVTMIGFEGGGHVGMDDVASFILIPKAVEALDIPVIAGGAICNGRGFLGALAMGAEGILMGTAFLASRESPAHDVFKERIIQANETDTRLVMRTIRNPLRCLKNQLAEEVLAMEEKGVTLGEIITKVAGHTGKQAYEIGDPDLSPIPSGQICGLINEIKPVRRIVESIIEEAMELKERLDAVMV